MNSWSLAYRDYDRDKVGLREALCAVGNGYFVTRGAAPECEADGAHYPGTYIAGVYNRLRTEIAGRTVENEDLVNVPNWLPLTFRIGDGPWYHIDAVSVADYRLELDMRHGVLHRRVVFEDSEGHVTELVERRFVHMRHRHIAALETSIRPLNWSGTMQVRSALDGTVLNDGVERYKGLANRHLLPLGTSRSDGDAILLEVQTVQSKIRIALAARTTVRRRGARADERRETNHVDGQISQIMTVETEQADAITIEKVVSLFTSRDRAIAEPGLEAAARVERAPGFDGLLSQHVLAWDQLWRRFDVQLRDGDDESATLRLHVFQLLQTVSPNSTDLDVGLPARGWHGEAYRGHVFWDELFVFPFITSRMPELTRGLLEFRSRRVPEALRVAEEAGYEGAMFPWQSGSDGREETQSLHLNPRSGRWLPDASRLQRHVNLAIAYNVWQYYRATADTAFLAWTGSEMLLQICRFWASVARLDPERDRYVICGVMGPDEYHDAYPGAASPGLDNNAYTNVLAAWVLARGRDVLDQVPSHRRGELMETLQVRGDELERWDDMSRRMFVPFHEGIISQFEGYEDLPELDWRGYEDRYGDIARLDRILEAEGDSPNNYKVSKQADVLMLFYLFAGTELDQLWQRLGYRYDEDLIARNVSYYSPRTSHGSTLSSIVHAWVHARMDRPRSWQFFKRALTSDIDDAQGGTTKEGIHIGSMAGAVDLVQRGYLGVRALDGHLLLSPALPTELRGIDVRLQYRGNLVEVSVSDSVLSLSRGTGEMGEMPIAIRLGDVDERLTLGPGEVREVDLRR